MRRNYHFGFRMFCLCFFLQLGISLSMQAQQTIHDAGDNGLLWKDAATMQLIIQTELTETNTELVKPNLTDWSTAMLEAYKSFLTHTQSKMAGSTNMVQLLDSSYGFIKTETVINTAARKMVLDDMVAKQQELVLKLTFN